MDKAKRKAIIAGNWKMNKTASEAAVLVDELIPAVKDASCEVVIVDIAVGAIGGLVDFESEPVDALAAAASAQVYLDVDLSGLSIIG